MPQEAIAIGVPGYTQELGVRDSLALPFIQQRDAWTPPPEGTSVPLTRSPDERRMEEIGS